MLDPRDSLGEADNQSAGLSEIAGRAGRYISGLPTLVDLRLSKSVIPILLSTRVPARDSP